MQAAFALGETVTFSVEVPQETERAEMHIFSDATGECHSYPMEWDGNHFFATISMDSLCEKGGLGLYFYKYRVYTSHGFFDLRRRAFDLSLFFADADEDKGDFRLFLYEKREVPPKKFYGGVMYQIFPDRFFSAGNGTPHAGAKLCRDPLQFPSLLRNKKQNDKNDLFFGGDLAGIEEKLSYLSSLGVTCLYLNPIFEAPSSHRYNTGDYSKVDSLLGGEDALVSLIASAKKAGIDILLDGVFNHTGSDSLYFNAEGSYPSVGAAQSKDSPYAEWYSFSDYPRDYEAWWGIMTLPRVVSDAPSYREFLFGKDGILRKYMRLGIAGWRLDVADELSDSFLAELYRTAREEKEDALVLGEVWENAAEKVSYGVRKKYLCGREMDSVMNYPIRNAIISYLTKGDPLSLLRTLTDIYEIYPPQAVNTLMNILGTHDTPRILTALSGIDADSVPYEKRAEHKMSEETLSLAKARLRLAVAMQMTLPGIPCIYYGDEAGMEGFGDPFCRMPFPWGREDESLLSLFRTFGKLREAESLYAEGDFTLVFADSEIFCFERSNGERAAITIINRSGETYGFHAEGEGKDLLSDEVGDSFTVLPMSYRILAVQNGTNYTVMLQTKGNYES